MCLIVDQRQSLRSFDPLLEIMGPSDRQPGPSFWTVRRRHTSSVSANYGFNKCEPKAMPLGVSSFRSLFEHLQADLRSKSWGIILQNQGRRFLGCGKCYGNRARCGDVVEFVIEQVCDYSKKKVSVRQYRYWTYS